MLLPGPDHPITVTPTAGRVRVSLGGRTTVDTDAALTLQESTYPAVQYIPLTAVDPAVLRPSDTTTVCPYKGTAGYFDLVGSGGTDSSAGTISDVVSDAVWIYRNPFPAVAAIAEHVAFYPQYVTLEIDDSARV